MKSFIQSLLAFSARKILAKYNPLVIGVTGSVGKTSTKNAIFSVLARRYKVRRSRKNYNNEYGVPLTVIGASSPGKNIFGWIGVLTRAASLILLKQPYPNVLILELGVDHPGDMDFLVGMVKPKIGVLTAISPAHMEFFPSFDAYAKEKQTLIENLPQDGVAILNHDNADALRTKSKAPCPSVTYGLSNEADIRVDHVQLKLDRPRGEDGIMVAGITMKVLRDGTSAPLVLREAISPGAISAALAAIAVGTHLGMHLIECVEGLDTFVPPPGRMRVISGIKYTTIIDDTYNSSPLAAHDSLGALRDIPIDEDDRRIAVLGDMLELGGESERLHQEVGKKVAESRVDILITVGERARDIARGAQQAGFTQKEQHHFADSTEAGRFLQNLIKIGDVLLIKGSQGVRMEKIVKELMAEPLRAAQLLVRQEAPWV